MKQKKSKSHLPLRLNLLFFLIFLLFSLLILQLGVVQILYGQNAQEEINRTDQETSKNPVPRGRMFDRTGELMVDNEPVLAITYTPPKNVQPEENLEVAKTLVEYIDMTKEEVDSITDRDLKDYWIMENHDKAYGRLSAEEEDLDSDEQYQLVLEKIKEEDINNYSDQKLEMIAIFRKLNQATALTPHIIKRGESVTNKEYAIIAENLSKFDGVNVTTDWDRNYLVEDGTFKNFVGSISTTEQGIPNAELDYFLSHNYSRNDRVGRSGLEEYYELQLSGQKEIREHITDSSGNVLTSELVREGERGKDLVLSVDLELQKRLDKIVGEELQKAIEGDPYENQHMSSAMAVMLEPNTGEILAMTGQTYNRDAEGDEPKLSDESFKVVNSAYQPGSTVKGATVLAGLDSGVISPGEVIKDQTIQLPAATGSELTFSSYSPNLGSLNDIGALRESSNVYMGFIALRMNGITNHQYDYRNSDMTITQPGFKELRNYYSQFGLGVATGVDLPHESTGYEGTEDSPLIGKRMQYAIGQYHSYTTLQLGQYVSTIANDGYRMAPRLVKQMHNPGETAGLGPLYEALEPKVLNKISMDDSYIDRVQEGFRQVFQAPSGTASGYFADKDYTSAGKSGTAQTELYEDGEKIADVHNLNLVGYAPHDDPEVAFAVVVPHAGTDTDESPNYKIGERALDAYFEIRDERASSEESLEEETETESTN
ncbi:penicillin-binding transpeptidase domain-containing protein [Alkalibacillus almallahensis]|uniref:penicillin-binding transpeptidase domain-containing protein n=1 Tax=Alkalibacillus almallahensis TaxID=1379154 RepID=UPI001423483A|nr:cell division protein FtsI/penicillin-binding protein 2 [Alkalibacillus almallahensis]